MKQGEVRPYRRMVSASAVIALSLILAACTGGDEPGDSGSSTPTGSEATTSATASPTPPEMDPPERPAAIDSEGLDGVEQIARYFLELYQYAYVTGDLTEWERLSEPECVFCQSVIDNVASLHADGGFMRGGKPQIQSADVIEPTDGGSVYRVDIDFVEEPSVLVDANGNLHGSESGGAATAHFAVIGTEQGWRIREVTIEGNDA